MHTPWPGPKAPVPMTTNHNFLKMQAAEILQGSRSPFLRPEPRISEATSQIPKPSLALPKGPIREQRKFQALLGRQGVAEPYSVNHFGVRWRQLSKYLG